MKLDYVTVEDSYDDTTQIRTMTEQAKLEAGGLLLRTTVYTPHHISLSVCVVPFEEIRGTKFDPVKG
ncbi:MAG TPA: hypothetical protein EYH06_13495 [Chromatiales bacterium]|nr:hypothetical protein [Thiotrichales bacterium]HIP69578.1 hypothetical protein [Chromatiales bacterium]